MKNAPETLLPQEELEQREMQQLKDMLNGMSGKAKPAPQPANPCRQHRSPRCSPRLHSPPQSRRKSRQRLLHRSLLRSCRRWCLPARRQTRKRCQKAREKVYFQMFGTAEDEKPAARKPEKRIL